MENPFNASRHAPGWWAVVIPVDLGHEVRVIGWPGSESLDLLYSEIGCATLDLRTIGDLGLWVDDEGTLVSDWAVNGRVTWLGVVVARASLLVAGTVVVTLGVPDAEGDTQGLSRESAERVAAIARAVPEHDGDGLTQALRDVVDRGPILMTLDENHVPDGFVV